MFVNVTFDNFNQQALYDELCSQAADKPFGAVVTFTGLVRDFNHSGSIEGIELEHYPGMTEAAMNRLAEQAIARFSLATAGIVHRVGKIANHEQIVWVGCAAIHRQAAFDGACFIMDVLKNTVPLWKKEYQNGQPAWVQAKESDERAATKWLQQQK
ncbi:molybdenum cofactor biosynthesis protein MoaE [Alteromonas pelagimontana]|uniref:Molybdopterin synthase catalytic subunit n=1 Tax=Alteromonas pelagimontana TaxID=1858656 RepID=A0A6M4MH21_9ALTE|nr:molybdenum cofactor biosynthesis protein MoaE [Alteromonas pelagimontana]QJR82342.1 molybdenum cofactor biosynthesis protein MoaE [Alteromonas pelagimontana]